jgi:pimeloyl-ACP methyl ester carboxylesterase
VPLAETISDLEKFMNDPSDILAMKNNPFSHHRIPLGPRLFLSAARSTFRITSWISPKLTAALAIPLFMRPPKYPVPRREWKIRNSANLETHEILGEQIAVRTWGEGPNILLCHGWGGRSTQFFALIDALVEAGYRAIAFDAPAHGDSSGKYTNMLKVTQTLATIAEREGPIRAVIGHSFGCGATLLAIDRYQLPSDKVILFSCFSDTYWITQQFAKAFSISEHVAETMRQIARRRYADHFDKPWDWDEISPVNTVNKVKGSLLLIHDRDDNEIPYEHALKLKQVSPQIRLFSTERLGHKKILMEKQCINACIDHIEGWSLPEKSTEN